MGNKPPCLKGLLPPVPFPAWGTNISKYLYLFSPPSRGHIIQVGHPYIINAVCFYLVLFACDYIHMQGLHSVTIYSVLFAYIHMLGLHTVIIYSALLFACG